MDDYTIDLKQDFTNCSDALEELISALEADGRNSAMTRTIRCALKGFKDVRKEVKKRGLPV